MIFQHTWEKVLSGEKTQTRRIVKAGETLISGDVGYPMSVSMTQGRGSFIGMSRAIAGAARFVTGKTYAVQPGRGKKAVARIRITGIRREDVREISDDDARAEGFDDREDFWHTWVIMHDKTWYEEYHYNVTRNCLDMNDFASRPPERYDAWVLEFELAQND